MGFDPAGVRGFNYQPSYSSHLQYTWTHFERAAWEREVPFALRFGSNLLRIWLNWSAFLAVGERMLDALDQALAVIAGNGMRAMPVLFNRWNDGRYPAGMVTDQDLLRWDYSFAKFDAYVDALGERFGGDERVAIWDLCNEPQAPRGQPDLPARETVWLATVGERLRRRTAKPITIGTMTGDNVRAFAPLVDVISFHPYPRASGEMEGLCKAHLAIAERYRKPLLATETCCGSLDDAERGELARENIETLETHGIGWLAWQLTEGRFVTGSRERTDSNAVRPNEGYMPFVLADGTTRPGHEGLERRGE